MRAKIGCGIVLVVMAPPSNLWEISMKAPTVGVALVSLMVPATASAEQLNSFDQTVIKRSVQCEFGQAAEKVYEAAPQPMLRGKIKLEFNEYKGKEVKTSAGFFGIGAAYKTEDEFATGYTIVFRRN